MVHDTAGLSVAPEAWLTVIVGSSNTQLAPAVASRQLYLTIRGSDLNSIRARSLPDLEARKLVVVTERR